MGLMGVPETQKFQGSPQNPPILNDELFSKRLQFSPLFSIWGRYFKRLRGRNDLCQNFDFCRYLGSRSKWATIFKSVLRTKRATPTSKIWVKKGPKTPFGFLNKNLTKFESIQWFRSYLDTKTIGFQFWKIKNFSEIFSQKF